MKYFYVPRQWQFWLACCWCVLGIFLPARADQTFSASGRRFLTDHVPAAVRSQGAIDTLAGTNALDLVIGLPLRNQAALTNLLQNLYDPGSTNFHQWVTPDNFTAQFGPTEDDYQKVVRFAAAHGLKVTRMHANRMVIDVTGLTTNIEEAFQVKMRVYRHPTENRNFFAPDTTPSIDTNLPILSVSGLDNFIVPHRLGGDLKLMPLATNAVTAYSTGSSPGGYFMGNDFRAAYVPGVTNTGAGQYIAIVDVGGPYYTNDIYMYETNAGLSTSIVISNVLLSGWSGIPSGTTYNEGEEVLDIDMAMSMAPGATILNYEGEAHDVFNQIAIDNKAKQMTLSYGFGIDASIIQMFQEFAAQGQSFSQASGDGGADLNGGLGLTGNPYATIVGGTSLTTSNAGGAWQSDTTWSGSGGGISGYGIPAWQQGIATTANQGSTTYRNYPDVAMPAVNVFTVYEDGSLVGATGGTSCASPLWAGFMALVNQTAAANGKHSAGFVNPSIYTLGKGSYTAYTNCFHDITTGNNINSQNPAKYYAETGYDLCTGWGTPTGSNTINTLAGIGTNDFSIFATPASLTLAPNGGAASVIQYALMNGLTGTVSLSVTGLPFGVKAAFHTTSTTNTSILTLALTNATVPGTFALTLTAVDGSVTHTLPLSLTITAPIFGATPVTLSFNRTGIYPDKQSFSSGGLDGGGYAYSSNLISSPISFDGVAFNLGAANTPDVVSCVGQTVTLPAGSFSTLLMLGTGVEGSQSAQTFTVTYTDNSTAVFSQGMSDWASPQGYAHESTLVSMPYRDISNGTMDIETAVNLYGYSLTLDQTKTVKSITLPNNSNVELLAMTLANTPASAVLTNYFNRAGMYTDGTTFTNPATGGLDGGGSAYSATLLGSALTWNGVQFDFGPANVTNVISAAGQTITLPKGKFSALKMLATGIQGDQSSQIFTMTYTDATTGTFTQSLSDWYTPQNNLGESNVLVMGHRNSSDGTADNRTFNLYGYTFKLNGAKTVQSFRLPSNGNVIVLAISLVPNWSPTFIGNPFSEPSIMAGQSYSGTVATNASDLNGLALSYSKISGPTWLTVAANGTLSGEPLSSNVGNNSFVVAVTDTGALTNQATLNINVTAAPPITTTLTPQSGNLLLNWAGGIAPYQVQTSTNLAGWVNLGSTTSGTSLTITPTNAAIFYRIVGQ